MKLNTRFLLILVGLLLVAQFSLGCYHVKARRPVPESQFETAQIADLPKARFWGDDAPPWLDKDKKLTAAELKKNFPDSYKKPHYYLALSGGGANGAYGAGLLTGWTEEGSRPEFTIVTGISTGALIAPFAFLGPKYDLPLKEVYTTIETKHVLKKRSFWAIFRADALANSIGLRRLIGQYITEDIRQEIAREHNQGRRLFIGTTNIDIGRPVIWNIGIIANRPGAASLELIRDLMLASASIPGAFPPVFIDVESDGKTYDEMHVDGGATSQVFLYPAALDWREVLRDLKVKERPDVFVIRNGWLTPKYQYVKPKVLPIMGKSVSTLIRTQGLGDLYRIYLGTERDHLDFHLAHIPDDFVDDSKEPFDGEFMNKLFELGYQQGKEGYPWKRQPPGFAPP